jgi:hypothetical protein
MKRTYDYEKKPSQAKASVKPKVSFLQTRDFAPLQTNLDKKDALVRPSGYSKNFLEKIINQRDTETSGTLIQEKPMNRLKAIASQRMAIQAKLNIGEPNDKYEQEADRTAAQVVQQINASPQDNSAQRRSLPKAEDQLQAKFLVQRRENLDDGEASTDLESSIQSARGRGQSLEPNLQAKMGLAMGADFSGVKVHTDSQSDQLSKSIQAKAFTTGQDVFFGQGQYNPTSRGGQELIAHELTHVVQQKGTQAPSGQSIVHKAPDQIQRLISKDDFVSLAGGPSTKAKIDSSTYTKILQCLKQCESENIEDRKKTIYENLKRLCTKWLGGHTDKINTETRGVIDYIPKDKSDETKAKHIAGLLKEVLVVLGEKSSQIKSETPSQIINEIREEKEASLNAIKNEEEKASEGSDNYKLTLLAAVENPYLIDFAKKRLALTIENKRKLRSKNKKNNTQIKNEAAKQVLMEKEGEQFTSMNEKEQLKAIEKLAKASSAVGHTWVNLTTLDTNSKPLNRHSFGFYPKEFYNQPTVPVPGKVVYPDTLHESDPTQRAVDYKLTKKEYNQALDFAKIQLQSPPQYLLTGYNCTFFAKKMVETVGKKFPGNAFMTVPTGAVSAITGLGKDKAFNPNALYDELMTYDGKDGGSQSYEPKRIERKKELTPYEKMRKCVSEMWADKFTLNHAIEEKYSQGNKGKRTLESGREIKITNIFEGLIDNETEITTIPESRGESYWVDNDVLYNAIADQVLDTLGLSN